MAAAGDIVAGCLAMLRGMCRPGVTTGDLDRAGDKFIRGSGRRAGVPGLSRLSGLDLHLSELDGRARHPRRLRAVGRRLLSIDVGVEYEGWVADAALTVALRPVSPVAARLLKATRESLEAAVEQCRPGNRLGRRVACRPGAGGAGRASR